MEEHAFNEILVSDSGYKTSLACIVTVKNDIWNLLATLVKPPPAAFTVRHRFFSILWQTAVTVELYFFHSWPLTSHHFGRKGGHSQGISKSAPSFCADHSYLKTIQLMLYYTYIKLLSCIVTCNILDCFQSNTQQLQIDHNPLRLLEFAHSGCEN